MKIKKKNIKIELNEVFQILCNIYYDLNAILKEILLNQRTNLEWILTGDDSVVINCVELVEETSTVSAILDKKKARLSIKLKIGIKNITNDTNSCDKWQKESF